MAYLLDTNVFIWLSIAPEKITAKARDILEDINNVIYFSPINLMEIAIKKSRGGLDFLPDPLTLEMAAYDNALQSLPFDGTSANALMALPDIHKDPFDRMLIAQGISTKATILTSDKIFKSYSKEIILL